MTFALSPLLGTPALGQSPAKAPNFLSQHSAAHELTVNLRLPPDQLFVNDPVMNPETAISANSTLGFGLVRAGPRIPDARLYGIPHSRSAALKFRLKF
jgi:hypothetical protein